jgi:hypothetical protein
MNAREALRDIYERHQELTPTLVVDEARPKTAPLHDQFVWDDKVAGEQYRLVQAGNLIRKFKITYGHTDDGAPLRVREYVSIQRQGKSPTYVPSEDAVTNPLTLAALRRECLREAAAFKAKYEHLADYSAIVSGLLTDQAS